MQYDFSLNANGGQNIDAVGAYVKYKSGLGAIRVRFSTGGYVDLTPGQGIRLAKQEFNSLNLTDKSGNANQGVLVIGDVDFQDDTISGTVSVVDGGKNSTLAKQCFLGTADSGTAGSYNCALLINPAANTRNLIVEKVIASVATTGTVAIYLMGINPVGNVRGANKYAGVAGGQPSTAILEGNFQTAMALYTGLAQKAYISTNAPMVRDFDEPLIVPPGMAVVVVHTGAGNWVLADFEWREDLV